MAFAGEHMVPIEDAQKLERKLNDALTALAMLGDRYERELAEAQKEIVGWNNKWQVAVEMAAIAENQRAALAHALRSLCIAIISEEPRDITDLLKQSAAAIAAVEGGSK
jgi:hypothetical protein